MAALETRYWWFAAKRAIILHLLRRYLEPPHTAPRPRIADVGCGPGALLADLAADGYDAVGVDDSADARALGAERGLSILPGTLPDNLPFEPASCDAVILSDVLEHVEADRASVLAVADTLRPGGLLIATVPAHPFLWTKRDEFHHHKRRYTARAFRALFENAPLEPIVFSYYNSALFPALAAVRLAKKTLGLDRAAPDIRPLPGPLNGALRALFEVEKHILPRARLPFGASLIAVCRRRPVPAPRNAPADTQPRPGEPALASS